MFVEKRKIIKRAAALGFLFLLVFSSAGNSFAQRRGEGDERSKLTLEKNTRENGYRLRELGDDKFEIKILGATNPQTGKKLNGKYDFVYRCKLAAGLVVVAVILAKGYAEREIRCRLDDDPYLYY